MADLDFPHLFLPDAPDPIDYRNPAGGGGEFETPPRPDRRSHADRIRQALENAWIEADQERTDRVGVSLPTRGGAYLEIESHPDFDLKLASFEDRGAGIQLLNVREEPNAGGQQVVRATIYIPHGKHTRLINKIQRYRDEQNASGSPKNQNLVANIEQIRRAVLQSFWYDPVEFLPTSQQAQWCEAWLVTTPDTRGSVVGAFRETAQSLGLVVQEGEIVFVERVVLLIRATASDLDELLASCPDIAEFRRAKETAAFWTDLPNADQADWVAGLAGRLSVQDGASTAICVVDTGANNGHPLLSGVLDTDQCDSVDAEWGVADNHGHGTVMCGTAAFGADLPAYLQSDQEIELPFSLQSVKLIDQPGPQSTEYLYGDRTSQAFSRAERMSPQVQRVYCLAVTSEDGRDRGRPSSWSGAIDKAIAGADDDERRLCVISAGNVTDPSEWCSYPDANLTNSIHDPAQAWNALSVGAITYLESIDDPELAEQYTPVARAGQLSPYSTTSLTWDTKHRWPNKPDIILEGGNVGIDSTNFASQFDSMSVLSVGYRPQEALLDSNYATSAAAGLAAQMCARLWAAYPNAWPETIRALMVHSAQWPEELRRQVTRDDATDTQNFNSLLRTCGYGMPDFQRAYQSAQNSLSLIAQQTIQPFQVTDDGKKRARDMHLYRLPWPTEALADLPGDTPVRIDITLSYFVEPAPGEKGWRDKYRYRSHGLDFNLKTPTETEDEFVLRLNKAARDDDADYGGSSVPWAIGQRKGRPHGSIHRDWVDLTAAEALACGVIGVFPRTGWWKERDHLGHGNSETRYSLIVTIKLPDQNIDVDLYTPVALEIEAQIENTIDTTRPTA